MTYDLGQMIFIRRKWDTEWVKPRSFGQRSTERVLVQSWYVEVPVDCEECSYWHNEFEANTRQGLINQLRGYKSSETRRINEIIRRVEALDEIGEPDDYLKGLVGEDNE